MTYYLLLPRPDGKAPRPRMTDEEMESVTESVMSLEAEMKAADAWVFGGRLHEPATATVVRSTAGEVMTTDGPFAETKEHVGGLYLLRAESQQDALAWAGKVSDLVGVAIEVRAFVDELSS